MTRRQNKKKKQNKNNNQGGMVMFKKPPTLQNYEVKQNMRLRFTSVASALRTQISAHDLTDLVLVALTATTAVKLFPCFKLKFVEVWDDDVAGNNASIAVAFSNTDANQIDDPQVFEDISMGIYPAHVLARPKKDSLSSKWHGDSGNNLFAITCSANAIVDVGLSFRNLPGTTLPPSNALVGAVAGLVYFRGLDGAAIATTNFLPPIGTYRI